MRIAHISDIHLHLDSHNTMVEEFYVLLKKVLQKEPDHLVITGDISDNAQNKDLELCRVILGDLGLLNSEKTSVVIGNHDIYGGVFHAEDIFHFPVKCKNIDFSAGVSNFNFHFRELFENCIYISENDSYPFAKMIKDTLLIGINSNAPYSKIQNPFASNGIVNAIQREELIHILQNFGKLSKHIVILVHHHFNRIKSNSSRFLQTVWNNIEKQTMKLRKKKALFQIFREFKVDIVLHGHLHEQADYVRKGTNFLNSGASLKNDKHLLNFNLIDFSKDELSKQTFSIPFDKTKFRSDKHIQEYRMMAGQIDARIAV